MDYKETLILPNTDLPMKANLSVRETEMLKHWQEINLYGKIRKNSTGKPTYILHDGPPYANGNIHIGTSLNKLLKDFMVKIKNMEGYDAPYVPGWDCHGLPIEIQVEKELGAKKREMSKGEIRRHCRKYAEKYINIQREEFKRLGVLADWDNPYLTMNYSYESSIVSELGKLLSDGYVYKGLKPIYWCSSCKTALAEAEVEYKDHTSPSIYVKMELKTDSFIKAIHPENESPIYIVIWTTTPWTLPANLAVCVHPHFQYAIVNTGKEILIIAKDLVDSCMEKFELTEYTVDGVISGAELEGEKYLHVFTGDECPVILGDHVTLEQGTGCVHTAPGHGQEDYVVGQKYGLDVYNPVDDNGKFIDEIEYFAGMKVFEANKHINDKLREIDRLLKEEKLSHSYPHCWRCKKPIIFRSTSQWFISMDYKDLRKTALSEIKKVDWIPSWGNDRIYNMVENRPDWCISRQRAWGVPITVFYCKSCREVKIDSAILKNIAEMVALYGADVWFDKEESELLPPDTRCDKCEGKEFEKETDILDVWFDSGVSHFAVLEINKGLSWPADIYIEGSDQHRGWFHSSLLESIATKGNAPYRSVLTHGYVVDGKGKKMSKSAGNVISPQKVINRHGAEILRLWVASENYKEDVRISEEILRRLTEAYRKMRNTFRYLLGNLNDFNVKTDIVAYEELFDIDKFILHKLQKLTDRIRSAYSVHDFHVFYHSFNNFCTTSLSAFYLDILKDRLYTYKKDSVGRRSAQTALYTILKTMLQLAAPILTFTSEEVWAHLLKIDSQNEESVHLSTFPEVNKEFINDTLEEKWNKIISVRNIVSKALETARRDKIIGHSLDSRVILSIDDENICTILKEYEDELCFIFIVSQTAFIDKLDENDPTVFINDEIPGLKIKIDIADGKKCERCWNYSTTVGDNQTHSSICNRCIKNIST